MEEGSGQPVAPRASMEPRRLWRLDKSARVSRKGRRGASTAARAKATGVRRDLDGRAMAARGACPRVVHAARELHREPLGSRGLHLLGTGAPWSAVTSI
jgi:tRNA U34 5-methylaminomethyl-2-thiouridine-forming methyltransferase MnmC